MVEVQRQRLSPDNPWPGLDPFDETDRDYFHGRAAESGELLRLVRREPLTVLFGRSGLGKTSLLKAGLFPLLRGEDGLPVYVRLDHAEGAPALREQVLRALQTACDDDRVQAARPAADESLWSFFHRRDAEFWSQRNRPVTPVIVFDQFEEIFTLGQESEGSRARSAAFLAELGDLVENRPPDAVREALEAESTAARRFDFKRSTVKLVLSFREDFLAEMEGLKERMPSLMYNRFRLLAMSGAQAYDVITRAGGHLVDDDVARRIIRLAWKNEPSPAVEPADFPKIEIDPALLSVVCSELNHKRQQAEPPLARITPALLEGADREILAGFYERGMVGLDSRVRAFVEDELITDRGYRDSHALEDALALPGVSAEALDALIRRRLLRVDERQSVRRLELTHDVLARVVKESRDSRRTREAEEAAKARERAALAQQQRNRRNAALVSAGALVVSVLAVLAGWFAWQAARQREEARAQVRIATSRKLVADSRLPEHSFDRTLLLAAEAFELAPTREAHENLIRLFHDNDRFNQFLFGHGSDVTATAFRSDGRRLATGDESGHVLLWERAYLYGSLQGYRRLGEPLSRPGTSGVQDLRFSPSGDRLLAVYQDGAVLAFPLSGARATPEAIHKGLGWTTARTVLSQDGFRLAVAAKDGSLTVWDLDIDHSRGQPLVSVRAELGAEFTLSPLGDRLAVADAAGGVTWWDVPSGRPHRLGPAEDGPLHGVGILLFSRDGTKIAAVGGAGEVVLWDFGGGDAQGRVLMNSQWPVRSIAFSSTGKHLAAGVGNGTVSLWTTAPGRIDVEQLRAHRHGFHVVDLAFGSDDRLLASASEDGQVVLWYFGRPGTEELISRALVGHGAQLSSVVFGPGNELLSSSGRALILWNVAITWDRPFLSSLPRNQAVFSWSFDPKTKTELFLPTGLLSEEDRAGCALVRKARITAGRELTDAEKKAAIGGLSYTPACAARAGSP